MWKSVALVAGLGGMFGAILAVAAASWPYIPIPVSKRSPICCQAPTAAPAVIPAAADWLKPSLPDATVFHPVWPARLILKRK